MNAVTQSESTALAVSSYSAASLLMDAGYMDRMERIADLMASGRSTMPDHIKTKGDCFAIVLQSMQWGMNPIAVAQKTFMVSGKLGYEAQLVSAVVNSSGVVKDRFHFEWFGPWEKIVGKFKEVESRTKKDDNGHPKKFIVPDWNLADEKGLGVRVWATLAGETAPREITLLMTQARTRNSTLWAEDPKQQLAYLAQKRWARLYTPDVLLGVYTRDELEPPQERFMGEAEEVPPAAAEVVMFPQERFEKNLPSWREAIAARKMTAEAVIAKARTVGALTPEQEALVKAPITDADRPAPKPAQAVTDVEPKSEPQPAEFPPKDEPAPALITVTFAQVNDAMQKAADIDALYTAADLLGEVADPKQREELTAIFEQRQAALGG